MTTTMHRKDQSLALPVEPDPGKRKLSTAKAMQEAISQRMARDESVFVMGEDVGPYGGIFSSTTGLIDRFGPERVLDTPISETAFIGLGIGAAVEGMRPIVELMFADFFGVCMDQVNHPRGTGFTEFQAAFTRANVKYDYANRTIFGDYENASVPNDYLRLPGESLWSDQFNGLEIWNGFNMADSDGDGLRENKSLDRVMRDWLSMLSLGLFVTPAGNSDTHTTVADPVGMPRTYIRVADDSAAALDERQRRRRGAPDPDRREQHAARRRRHQRPDDRRQGRHASTRSAA